MVGTCSRPSTLPVSLSFPGSFSQPPEWLKDILKDCVWEPSGAILFSRVGNIYIFFLKANDFLEMLN